MGLKEIIKNLISLDEILSLSSEEIIGQVCERLYEKKNWSIRDNEVFTNLPVVLKDIILTIDFDTELMMNGIIGFLENSTGLYLEDTVLTLERLKATEDCKVLRSIGEILQKYGLSTYDLRVNVNNGNLYELTTFGKTHSATYLEMAEEIENVSKELYLYKDNGNIFEFLKEYVENNKMELVKTLYQL